MPLDAPAAARPEPVVADAAGTARGTVQRVALSRTQQVVARRVAEARATIPDFTVTAEIDMRRAEDVRTQLRGGPGPGPTLNDLIVKACGLALREFPRVNGAYRDGAFELHSRVNVGIAVAAGDELVIPTVFDADTRSLAEIAATTRELAARARAGLTAAPELSGATFTVSNLGMHGVTGFTAVISPPQAAVLAVGTVGRRGIMRATLTCDHRIVYGAEAARFLTRVGELLGRPAVLLAQAG